MKPKTEEELIEEILRLKGQVEELQKDRDLHRKASQENASVINILVQTGFLDAEKLQQARNFLHK